MSVELLAMFFSVIVLVVATAVPLDRSDEDLSLRKVLKSSEDEKKGHSTDCGKCDGHVTLLLTKSRSSVQGMNSENKMFVNVSEADDVFRIWNRRRQKKQEGDISKKGNYSLADARAEKRFEKLKEAKSFIWAKHKIHHSEVKNKQVSYFLLKKLAHNHARLFYSSMLSGFSGQKLKFKNKQKAKGSKHVSSVKRETDSQQFECRFLRFYHKQWILMVASCPRSFSNKTLRAQCENVRYDTKDNVVDVGLIPVQLQNGVVFRNIFCAVCNGVKNIEAWDVNIICNGVPPLRFVDGSAQFELSGKTKEEHQCRKTLIPKFKDKVTLCLVSRRRSYTHRLLDSELNLEPTESLAYPVSFSILMNFGFDGKAHILFSTTHKEIYTDGNARCSQNEVYNPDNDVCQEVGCPPGYVLSDMSCNANSKASAKPPQSLEQELRELDKPKLVRLRVNVSQSEVKDLTDSVSQKFVRASLCDLLNISCERIQNFTIMPVSAITNSHKTLIKAAVVENQTPYSYGNGVRTNRQTTTTVSSETSNMQTPTTVSSEASKIQTTTTLSSETSNTETSTTVDSSNSQIHNISVNAKGKNSPELVNVEKVKSAKSRDKTETSSTIPVYNSSFMTTKQYVSSKTTKTTKYSDTQPTNSKTTKYSDSETTNIKTTKYSDSQTTKINTTKHPNSKSTNKNALKISELPPTASPATKEARYSNTTQESLVRYSASTKLPVHSQRKKNDKELSQRTVVLELSFLLMPLENDVGRKEDKVSNVMQRMRDVIDQQKLTLFMNGTKLQVVTMDSKESDTIMNAFCRRGIQQMYFNDEFNILNVRIGNETVDVAYVNETHTQYLPGMYDLTVLVSGDIKSTTNIKHQSMYLFVCVMPRIDDQTCVRLNFTENDYKLLPNKSIIMFDKLYTMDEYYVIDEQTGDIEICVPEEFYTETSHKLLVHGCDKGYELFQKAGGYLTAILGRLSIVAMVTVLLTYILHRKLRNLPGVNTMNLTFSILAAQAIFTSGEIAELEWLCSLVAVSLHYFILASFFWMNVMTYDVFKTFANKCILTRIRSKNKFMWRYSLYAWGTPLVIVLICAFIDFSGIVKGFEIGYGGLLRQVRLSDVSNKSVSHGQNESHVDATNNTHTRPRTNRYLGCWIQNPVATLIVFGGPLLTIFIVNGFLFIRTILRIQKTARMAHISTRRSSLSHKTGRYDVMLYVRMSTVMGFTWVFGLASSIVSGSKAAPSTSVCYTVHSLSILFTTFNCSQGIFILFAFVAKRRVLFMYTDLLKTFLQKFKKWKQNRTLANFRSPPSSSSASSSTTSISHIT